MAMDELLKRLRENSEPIDPVELYATLDTEWRNIQTIHDAEKSGLETKLSSAEEKAQKEAAEKSRIQALLVDRLMNAPANSGDGDKAHTPDDQDPPKNPPASNGGGIMSLFQKVK